MQCSSIYPCSPKSVGLNILHDMSNRYLCDIGFSDHTLGFAAPIAAAAMGATVIEKHFTFSRFMYGSDAKHSMEPENFRIMSSAIKEVWEMNKSPVDKNDIKHYEDMKSIFEKSVVSKRMLSKGTILKQSDLTFKKPGTGISASKYLEVIGKTLIKDIQSDEIIQREWLR